MQQISKKKIIEERKRNKTKMGRNKKFPSGESSDIGSPQLTKMGSDTAVMNS